MEGEGEGEVVVVWVGGVERELGLGRVSAQAFSAFMKSTTTTTKGHPHVLTAFRREEIGRRKIAHVWLKGLHGSTRQGTRLTRPKVNRTS